LLVAGALLGGWTETPLFAGALLVEGVGAYLTSRHGNWRLHSVAHLTERHGLFIILAIGESVVAIGVGAAQQPISAPLLLAAVLGVAAAVGLWWLYFDMVSLAAEQRLLEAHGQARVDLAVEAYTYGHCRWWLASCWPPGASRGCWHTPMSQSRWAPSTRRRCSAALPCTWPGTCCSSGACTAR
jgi:low temperature requirement protein LtrA